MKCVFSKDVSTGNVDSWKFTSYIFLLPNILEYYFHDVIYLVNTDAIFTSNNVNLEEF